MIYGIVAAILVLIGVASSNDASTVFQNMTNAKKQKKFNDAYDNLFTLYGNAYGIDPYILKAIAANESTVGKNSRVAYGIAHPNEIYSSVSTDGKSWGLMQVTLPTARQFEPSLTEADLNNPDTSVRIAAKYLQWVKKNYNSDLEFYVRAYNGGAGWQKTKIGPNATAAYYSKFQKNYNLVKEDGGL